MIMQPASDIKTSCPCDRITLWVSGHQSIARLIITIIGLIVVLLVMPSYLRNIFWDGIKNHKILTSLLLIFGILAVSLVWSAGQKIDTWVFSYFNVYGNRPTWMDRFMFAFTQLGSGISALVITLVLFITNNHRLAFELILGSVLLWLIVLLIKILIHRSRPFFQLTEARIIGGRAIGHSFPSGHTSQAFFLAVLLTNFFHVSIWVNLLFFAAALMVGITRMYVGAHYPRDVLAGIVLGSAWGLIWVVSSGFIVDRFG
jgi:membrane-associated phospholipid phosphatase